MTLRRALLGFVAACGLTGQSTEASAQSAATPTGALQERLLVAEQARQKLDAPFLDMLDKAKFSGFVGFSDGRLTSTYVIARAKVNSGDKGYNAPLWRWASVTKQVIAVLVMQEVANGTIALDQPVARYLPGFGSAAASRITVRQLLRHQSGLPNPDDTATGGGLAAYYQTGYKGNRSPLTGYCAGPAKGEPGGTWAYNNCDYIVAGALLEAVTGKRWAKLVEERIAKPLGLKSLRAFPGPRTHGGLIGGAPEPPIDFAAFGAAGGLSGSPEDLLRFDLALLDGRLLAAPQRAEMWDGQPELGFIALGQWAFEARIKDCAKPVRLVERRGAIGGVQVRNFLLPDKGLAVVVFADKGEGDLEFGEIWQGSGLSHDILNFAACKTELPQP